MMKEKININYYDEIKENLIKCEVYDVIKDYSKDKNKVNVYYNVGKLLSLTGKEYGKNIIKQYSEKLMIDVGKKYNERTLRRIRQFYETFCNEKWSTSWTKLCWSHYREVLPLKDIYEIRYYLNECQEKNLTIKQLQTIIKNNEYNRLSIETKNKIINSDKLKVNDLILNPIVIKANMMKEKLSEYTIKQAILNNLDSFLNQLGTYYTYVGNEYKIKVCNSYNYIDILLYNIRYKCYVVIELKAVELKKEHIGQIQVYMNYIDKNIKTNEENETIGIIICKRDNKYIIEYCSDDRIISREYLLV